jgi:hypothetical protein
MRIRLGLLALAALLLAGCNTVDCAANSNNNGAAGGCGLHSTF